MEKLQVLEAKLREEGFVYQTFFENLKTRLSPQEIMSINVLGQDFFDLVDQIAAQILIERVDDSAMLSLSLQEFLWELQIFANQFIRVKCGSVLKLKAFCEDMKHNLEDKRYRDIFSMELNLAFENYFYVSESTQTYLV